MKRIVPRPITSEEAAIVKQALLKAALTPVPTDTIQSIESLCVIAECECGCRSVEFESSEAAESRLSDGVGYLLTGERVDVMVWGRGTRISSLEIVDHLGAGKLPVSVCSWEEAGKMLSNSSLDTDAQARRST
jgi:hypothetical protein